MKAQWLAVQSFHHSQDLLDAINTLSIYIKLWLAGIPDEGRGGAAERARETLASFLKELQTVVQEAGQIEAKPVMGADPRLRQLAKSFMEAKRDRHRFRSVLFRNTLPHVEQLLCSDTEEDRRSLLQCLQELRVLLEEHIHVDAARILGEI